MGRRIFHSNDFYSGGVRIPNYIGDKNEKKYEKITELGNALHIPVPTAFLTFKCETAKGEVIHEHSERAHSWTRNGYNWLTAQMCGVNANDSTFGGGYLNVKDVGATVRYNTYSLGFPNANLEAAAGGAGYMGAVSTSTIGLVVGTDSTAYSFENYMLGAQIAHGTGSGQLSHNVSNAPTKSYDAGTKVYTVVHVRTFTNSSGSSITVNEAGLRPYLTLYNPYSPLVMRDVLAGGVAVANLIVLTVSYTLQVTYPA